jgi:integrase
MASIEKRFTARGERRYDVRYRTPAGVVRTRTWKRRRDADAFAVTIEADKRRGDWVDPQAGRRTFGDLAEEWLEIADVKPKTRASYRSLLDRHLLPTLKGDPVAAITTSTAERLLAKMRQGGAAPNTIRNVRNVMSAVCRYGVRCGAIRSNPLTEVQVPKGDVRREMVFLSASEVAGLAGAIDGRYRLAVLLSAYTGLRAGEMAALRVGRVDLMRRRLRIVESVGEVHGALVGGTPKNGRSRLVPIPRFLVDELTAHMAPVATDPNAFVFTSPQGGQVRQSLLYRRYFQPAAVAQGLGEMTRPDPNAPERYAGMRWHDLRHTAVALMVSAGVEPLVISRVLGHGSISITYDVYGHVLPSLEEKMTDALDEVYAVASEPVDAPVRAIDAR